MLFLPKQTMTEIVLSREVLINECNRSFNQNELSSSGASQQSLTLTEVSSYSRDTARYISLEFV